MYWYVDLIRITGFLQAFIADPLAGQALARRG
jgi:hypothetical protein